MPDLPDAAIQAAAGPSGGVLGKQGGGVISQKLVDKHPDLAREFVTIGQYPRAGHDRSRWETFARRAFKMWSWERAECEAMRRRGQTLERPCFVSETGDGAPAGAGRELDPGAGHEARMAPWPRPGRNLGDDHAREPGSGGVNRGHPGRLAW